VDKLAVVDRVAAVVVAELEMEEVAALIAVVVERVIVAVGEVEFDYFLQAALY
jgi:hypothetical protein